MKTGIYNADNELIKPFEHELDAIFWVHDQKYGGESCQSMINTWNKKKKIIFRDENNPLTIEPII